LLLFCSLTSAFAQQISVDGSIPLQQLIEDNLIQNGCVEISNITSSINGTSFGFSSYGQFNRSSSNFPFQSGIMLTTGNASSGGNTVTTPVLSEGASNWGGDADLETALGINNTFNATSIEFDLISTSNQLQFNYLFASEEYFSTNPCNISDGFAFLIKETASAAPYQNIALVPGTASPVNTNTIHTDIFNSTGNLLCSAQNEQYFDGLGNGDTNYNGRTTTLTAATTIVPYVQYRIKLVIADQSDIEYDSAVFIEGNSFKILDLGEDISTCFSSTTLDADIQNPLASYEWFLNNSATPISGQTSATLNVTQSGTYRVEVTVPLPNGSPCVETDEIVVNLNIEEAVPALLDYQLCDDISNGAGTETFNLSIKNGEVVSASPFSNYNYTYHLSDTEARNNTNSIITPIQNTSNPQPIFVRINDLDTGCSTYTTFNLIVNSEPNIITPGTLEICDNDDVPDDGFYFIDLTQLDDEITGGLADLAVSYYYDATDANNSVNPISSLYRNRTTPTDQVFARVINTTTTCVSSVVAVDINVTNSPIINFETQYIDACDADHDGFAIFDLTQVLNNVLNGIPPGNVTATYHENYSDAELGINPIADPANYPNLISEEQTVYIRIQDNTTLCASVAPIEIHTNLLLTATDIQDFALCDNNADPNDELNFDLNVIEFFINNNLDFDDDPNTIDIDIDFFEVEANRDANVNAIDKSFLYSAPNQTTLYIRMVNNISGCIDVEEIRLLINPVLLFSPVDPIPYCDSDSDVTDGITTIDLHSLDDLITNSNTDFVTSFFPTMADASSNNTANQLPDMYTNTNSQETIFVRIENIDTGCYTSNSFDIRVIPSPETTQPSDEVFCETSDTKVFNLEDKIPEIVSNTTGIDVDFFTTLNDADNNTNSITNRTAYTASTQTMFVRVGDNTPGTSCYKIITYEIIINSTPVFPTTGINDFVICDGDINGEADFIFRNKDGDILNGQTGKEVSYFEDAGYTVIIDKDAPFTSGDRIVYVRIDNITDPTCNATSSFEIKVASDIVYNAYTPFVECDNESNDGKQTFDLDQKRNEIILGVPEELNVTFHLTQTAADNNTGALPNSYTNATNPQTIYVRIENKNSLCFEVDVLDINIIAAPDLTDANPLAFCDDDSDGFVTFDLAQADFEILDRVIGPPPVINYFENQADTSDDTLEIANPNNYFSDSKTVYIKVTNQSGCSSVIPLALVVNSFPTINTFTTVEDCFSNTNTFDLTQVNTLVTNNPSTVNISYHNNQTDAEDDLAAYGNNFNYTTPGNYTIWIRTENPITNCFITSSFVLEINPNPVANTPPDLEDCDDDYDGFRTFNLSNSSSTSNSIRGAQNASNFTVTYYHDLPNAENATNSIATSYPAVNGEIIYARIENVTTGCFSTTQFNVIVNEKPIIDIEDQIALCINNLPLAISAETGIAGDIYLWSTGETNPEIMLANQTDYGSYWVSVTRPSTGCFTTKLFEVIESAGAEILATATADFTDPNTITVEVSGIGDYVFSLDDGPTQTSNVFNNAPIGTHIVTITDLKGCDPTSIEVVVIDVPKFVTSNGDGHFDTWHITGVNQLAGTVAYIYNRMGKLLKTLPHTSVGWDGTFNGANMPSDDYWYSAHVFYKGDEFEIRGHFALKR
jgi:gliding motility-associated-like protein